MKGGKKIITKLEVRIAELSSEYENTQRKSAEAGKETAKQERKIHELQFQIDESKKGFQRMMELVDTLQNKLRVQKKQLEEAEELANVNAHKYRHVQRQIDEAEERADHAENSLSVVRSRTRSLTASSGLTPSKSAAVVRTRSRTNF
ncbi:hypothetical protein AB6A40_008951 [Gnathostoma spinigerum]|uniref:Paramyosin n=1 Tax=Gnathostoma spinigerum TaxID=75299 RepID=A0ABD6ESY3_9BILA